MHPIRRILVAVRDPHARRVPALAKAAQIAAGCGASLELFHGIDTQIPIDMLSGTAGILESLQRDVRDAALRHLERLARPLRQAGLRVTTSAEWDYPLYEAVVRQALQTRADLIVAHQHGKHRFPQLLHHTDWDLLRGSPVPVLLIRSPRAYRAQAVLAAVDPAHAFSKPAALDALILRQAQSVASALKAPLHVVHALLPFSAALLQTQIRYRTASEFGKGAHRNARKALGKALSSRNISVGRRHLETGYPEQVVPAVARRVHAAIVVMGAVSRSGWQRLFIGNTAERIIDELRGDLLIVKPADFGTRFPRRRRGTWIVPALTQF